MVDLKQLARQRSKNRVRLPNHKGQEPRKKRAGPVATGAGSICGGRRRRITCSTPSATTASCHKHDGSAHRSNVGREQTDRQFHEPIACRPETAVCDTHARACDKPNQSDKDSDVARSSCIKSS